MVCVVLVAVTCNYRLFFFKKNWLPNYFATIVNPKNNTWVQNNMGKIATIPNLATNQHPTLLLQLWSALLRKAMRDDQSDRRNEGSPGRHLPTSGGSWPNFSRFEAADADSKIHPRGHRQYPCRTAFWKKIEKMRNG